MRNLYLLVLALLCASVSFGQLTGTKTIPGDYATISAAVTALNSAGVGAGGVTFNVAAGHTETSNVAVITATGTQANPIVFQKSGAGANPKITASSAGTIASSTTIGGNGDGIIIINGGDYITFDGIDLTSTSFSSGNGMYEYGYFLKKASATNASKNITIKNCNITLNKAAIYSFGIYVSNISGTSSVTVTAVGGRSENIKIWGNTISNAHGGILSMGFAAASPYDLYDQNIEIGVDGGNTINNYGGGSTAPYGIYCTNANNCSVSNNMISGGSGTGAGNAIYLVDGVNSTVNLINNTVEVATTSTTGTVYAIRNTMGGTAGTVTIANNKVQNMSWTTATSGTFYGIAQNATATTINIYGNEVKNNTKAGTGATYLLYNINSGANGVVNMYNNKVFGNTHTSSGDIYGVYSNPVATTTTNIYDNEVYSLTAGNGSIFGIRNATGATINIYRNKVYNLTATGTAAESRGIYTASGTTITIYNNLVGDLKTPTSTGANSVAGLYLANTAAANTVKAYYNTIYLAATSSSTGVFGTSGVYVDDPDPTIELKNNIIYNASVPGPTGGATAALRFSASGTYSANSDNNLFWAGTPAANRLIYVEGETTLTNAKQTLTDYKTYIVNRDANSVTENVSFQSTTGSNANFLHINTATPTLVEGGATPIVGITTDFDGDTRDAVVPDLGADEGAFTVLDQKGPVINYTALTNTCATGDRTFTALIVDATGVPTSGGLEPRVYYRKGTGAWVSSAGTLTSGTATNGTWTFTLAASQVGGFNSSDVISYYVIAQDITPSAYKTSAPAGVVATDVNTVTTHPSSPNNYLVAYTLGGTPIEVGGGKTFTTLTAAVNAYNTACLTGPVTFTLTDATYGASETFPIVIAANPDASTTNTLTISPALNTAVNVTGTSGTTASALIRFDGADYVTIDGIRDAAGTSLTFENTSTTANTAVIWLSSNGAGQGATHNTLKNLNVKAGVDQKTSTTVTYGIVIAGSTLGTITGTTAGADNDNNVIDTCYITKVRYGILSRGASTANANTGNIIKRNIIGPATFGADQIGKAGMVIREEEGIQIINNEVRFVGGDYDNTSAGTDRAGIVLATDATWISPTSVYVKNASVRANSIHDIQDERTNSALAIILAGADGSNATNNIVANNFIYNIKANGTGSDQAVGIGIAAGNGDKVVYNSIYMAGSVNAHASATAPTVSNFGIRVASTTPSNLSILNNIVYMDLVGGGALKNFCIDLPASYTWGTGNLDYNDWYANPANPQSNTGSIGNGANISFSLTDWRTNSSKDLNSKDQDPQFVSLTDLHLQASSPIDGQGTPVPGVTTDIDNQARSASFPDMGADEIPETIGLDLKPQGLVSPVTSPKGCYGPAESIIVKIKNNGSVVADFSTNPLTITVNVGGANTATFTKTLTSGTLTPGAVLNVTMTTAGGELDMSAPGVYTFDINVPISGDVNTANDMLQEMRTKEALTAGAVTASPAGYCQTGGKPVLSTVGANGYSSLQWQQSTTSGSGYSNIAGATNTTFTLPTAITQTMYYKLVATCGTSTDESGESSVVLSNPQPTSTTPATRCGVGTVTLSATAEPGKTIKWYSALTGGLPLATGNNFTTPVLNNTVTYYAEVSESSGGGGTFVVGTGATTSTTYPTPFYSLWSNTHNQYLIKASELAAAGITGGNINSLGITITAAGTLPVIDLSIKMAHTTANDVSAFLSPSFTTVYTTPSLTPTTGLNTMTFSTPFQWDGTSNVVIEICHGNPSSSATMSRTAEVDNTTFVSTIHTHKSAAADASATCSDLTTNLTTYSIRPKFTFTSSGCAGVRVPVTATVTPPAPLTVTANKTICNNSIHELNVTSTVADFDSYIWTPATGLFTDAAATIPYTGTSASTVYVKNSTPSTTTYTLTATNTTTNCVNVATTEVIVMPAPVLSASQSTICVTGTPTISANPATGYGAGSLQWQSSPDGIAPYSNIAGATNSSYTTPAITQTSYYQLVVKDGAGAVCNQVQQTIVVNNPPVTGTTPATRCGVGTVTLGATTNPGNTLAWYTGATGGEAIGTGTSFVTPTISANTTYYVAAGSGSSSYTTGLSAVSSNPTSGNGTTNFGLMFDALTAFTLNTVTIYPISSTNASGTVTIDVLNSAGTVVHTTTVNVTGSPIASPQPQVVTLNFHIQPGTNYKIRHTKTGISGLAFEPSAGAPSGNYGYPFTVPGVVAITTSVLAATNAPNNDLYYYFYNWQLSVGCEGTRVPVVATVTAPPALTVTANKTICNNSIHQLQVTSTLSDYDTYVWSPATGLFTDPAATVPYVAGSSATEVYVKKSVAGSTSYTVTATNTTTNCVNVATSVVVVLPVASVVATPSDICVSGISILGLNPSSGYGAATFQWQSSPDGIAPYSDIATATNHTYTTPTINQTSYYKLVIKDGAGATCQELTKSVIVNNPQITGTTPATRCGTGVVSLAATATGGNVYWYNAASGGLPIATGNSYTTPVLTTNTTYYAAAVAGNPAGIFDVGTGATTSATYPNPFYSLWSNTHNQYLIRASELTAAGISAGQITSLGVDITAAGTLPVLDLSVKMGHTSATDASSFISTTFTTVYTTPSLTPVTGINTMTFSTPFIWDGISNVVIEVCHGNSSSGATMSRTAAVDNTSYVSTIHTHKSAASDAASTCGDNTTNLTTYSIRPKFTFGVAGCSSPRVAVTATVTAGPSVAITPAKTICNNEVHELQVTSNIADFDSYVWSPTTGLYTDATATVPYTGGSAAQVYVKTSTAGAITYTLTSTNTTTGCGSVATSVVTVMPSPVITSTPAAICVSGTTILSITPSSGYGTGSFQWQSSPDGVAPYTNINTATASSYTTPTLTQNGYYKLVLKDGAGTVCAVQPTYTAVVNNPQIISVTGGTRCGTGTVALSATASAGASLRWFATSTGGTSIGSGSSFTTPSISTTTNYYVESYFGNSALNTVGPVSPSALGTISASDYAITTYYQEFNVSSTTTIQSIDVFPPSGTAIGTAASIEVRNSSGAILINVPYTVSVNTGTTPQTIVLNVTIPPGTGYRIGQGGTAINLNRNTSGAVYPYTSGPITVTGNNFDVDYWYYIYNWKFTTDCISSTRTQVTATVNNSVTNATVLAGTAGGTQACSGNQNVSVSNNYFDNCNLIATIAPGGTAAVSGNLAACVKIENAVPSAPNGQKYVQRHFEITPAANRTTATSTVTLYFTQAEFDAYNTAVAGTYPTLPANSSDAAKSNLRVSQFNHGGVGSDFSTYPAASGSLIDPADANITYDAAANGGTGRWAVTFDATGSGAFYVHTGSFILPVTITNFRGEAAGSINKLYWSTSTETNNNGFELQRSADGINYSKITFVATKANGGNSTSQLSYNFDDMKPLPGINYYRLKQIDNNGKFSYSGVVTLSRRSTEITLSKVFPNPATTELNVVITSPRAEKLTIIVTDLRGKVVMQTSTNVVLGENQQQLNVAKLAGGTYMVKVICADGCETAVHRFVKQ